MFGFGVLPSPLGASIFAKATMDKSADLGPSVRWDLHFAARDVFELAFGHDFG